MPRPTSVTDMSKEATGRIMDESIRCLHLILVRSCMDRGAFHGQAIEMQQDDQLRGW